VETESENLGNVITEVSDGQLQISTKGIRIFKELNAYITVKELTYLEVSGASTIKGQTPFQLDNLSVECSGASDVTLSLTADELATELSGASEMELSGQVNHHSIELSGASHLQADNLVARVAEVEASGASSAHINVTDEVTTDISGASEITYANEPQIIRNINEVEEVEEVEETEKAEAEYEHDVYGPVSVTTDESGETVKVKVGKITVKVVDDDSVKIDIGDNRVVVTDDGQVNIDRCHKQKFNGHWGGFQMGVNGYFDKDMKFSVPDQYEFLELNYAKSLNYQLNIYEQNITLARPHFGLITGIGIQWTIYCLSKDIVLVADSTPIYGYHASSGNEFVPPYPDRNYIKSKLRLTYLTVPLLFEYQTNRFSKVNSFHVTGGVVGGWAFNIRSKAVWEDNGRQKKKVHDDYGIQPFRWDAYAGIGWGKLNLFGTYALNTLFKEGKGPDLYPFTLGLTIIGW
jgi:hypothetical protein